MISRRTCRWRAAVTDVSQLQLVRAVIREGLRVEEGGDSTLGERLTMELRAIQDQPSSI